MKKQFVPLFIVTLILCCTQALQAQNKTATNHTSGDNGKAASDKVLVFKAAIVYDQRAGMEAARLWIPKGWNLKSEVTWRAGNVHFPAGITGTITNPTGEIQYEVFPEQFYIYAPGQIHYASTNLGCTYINDVPGAKRAITNYLLPAVRRNVQGLRIIEIKSVGEQQDQGVTSVNMTAHIEYTLYGKDYEENIGATYTYVGSGNMVEWNINSCDGLRAPKGQLTDNLMNLFITIGSSLSLNHDWETMYVEVRDYLIKDADQKTAAAGVNSMITQRAFEHNRKIRQEGYDNATQTKYDINEKNDARINGQEVHHDLAGNKLIIPAGYDHQYINKQNDEIMLTNNPLDALSDENFIPLPP